MKKSFLVAFMFAFVAVSTAVMMPSKSEAIPAFARQVGMACTSCHFQYFPKLNAFGRAFKAGGYTDVGSQELIEDDHASLPAVLNAAFLTKTRYQKFSQAGAANVGNQRGSIQFPDEAVLWVGGRMAENWGAAIEGAGGGFAQAKFVYAQSVGFGKVGVSIYTSDAHGPTWGFAMTNTGEVRGVRAFEDRGTAIASQALGYLVGDATGITAYAVADMGYLALGLFGPAGNYNNIDTNLNLSWVARAAITTNLAGWDVDLGVIASGGNTKLVDLAGAPGFAGNLNAADTAKVAAGAPYTTLTTLDSAGWGIIGQAQGELAGMNTEFQFQYIDSGADITAAGAKSSSYQNGTAWNVALIVQPLDVLSLKIGYLDLDMNTAAGTTTQVGDRTNWIVGANYEFAQNVELVAEYGVRNWDAAGVANQSRFTLMLETVF